MIVYAVLCLSFGVSTVVSNSCQNRCYTNMDPAYSCQCNTECYQYDDCCSDYGTLCANVLSCQLRDCNQYDPSAACQCNDLCANYDNCCPDRQEMCFGSTATTSVPTPTTATTTTTTTTTAGPITTTTQAPMTDGSCNGRCGQSLDNAHSCQCNDACLNYGDCCSDYTSICQGSTGGNTGNCAPVSVSHTELETISLEMWRNNTNNFPYDAVTYDVQSSTTTSATNDVASAPFFTFVDESRLEGGMFPELRALQDNYIRTQGQTEVVTQQELEENDAFLEAFLNTGVGEILYEFLDSKNLAGCEGRDGFKTILDDIWFGMYDRQAPDDTSGFEHSFVGEIKGSGVSGFHNWVYFYFQEKLGNFNYQGYISQKDPRMVGMRHTWYGATKKMNGFTIGTSPEIEFGLYTLCFLAKGGSWCPIQMTDELGDVVSGSIQTYTWSNEAAPNGQSYVASAYFIS